MLVHPMVSETELMRRIALIGAGPTSLYTLATLIHGEAPLCITLFEEGDQAGVGMPYDEHANHRAMLANIASIEIPPLTQSYLEWLRAQSSGFLADHGVDKAGLHERQFLPRVLLGHYFRDQCLALVRAGRQRGHRITLEEGCRVVDLAAETDGLRLWTDRHGAPLAFDRAVIATGHVWPSPASGNRAYFPSPWTGLIDADLPAAEVGGAGHVAQWHRRGPGGGGAARPLRGTARPPGAQPAFPAERRQRRPAHHADVTERFVAGSGFLLPDPP
ncbi:MAG: FAD/NAD(P)-binding protein [Alcanivorax sp.]|nr:FAD/NAD(P)-binding protein [Alcanivorax sp.]